MMVKPFEFAVFLNISLGNFNQEPRVHTPDLVNLSVCTYNYLTAVNLAIMDNTITVKTDPATKKAAEALAKKSGLSLEGLVNACIKQAIASRHFEIHAPEQMTPKMEKVLEKAEQELAAGEFSEPFDNAEDAIAYLKKQSSR